MVGLKTRRLADTQAPPGAGSSTAEQEQNAATESSTRLALFEALRVRDFRHLWFGTIVSSIGTWMQMIGSGWLILQLTGSPFWLGMVAFASAVPVICLSLFAGVVADRVDRRRLQLVTQSVAGVMALLLAVLTMLGAIRLWQIIAIACCSGAAMAFDMPARQAMIPDLVGKEREMNAVGLNSAAFNGAAVIGPALAGIVVGTLGVAACFYLNALSFVAVIWAIWSIRTHCVGVDCHRNVMESLGQAAHFVRRRRMIFALFWLATVASLLARPYLQLMPVFARDVLGGGPRTYGLLMAASGVGALIGSLLTALLAKIQRKGYLLLGSAITLAVALIAFASSRHLVVSLGVLVLAGGGTTLYMGASNTLLQTNVPDEVRGRIMSVYTLIIGGFMPVGSLVLGSAASLLGNVSLIVTCGAGVVLVSALAVGTVVPQLRAVE